jgi:leucine-zipper-like transcriptional regulator 1
VVGGLSTNNDASVTQFYGDVWSTGNGSSWTNTLTTSNSTASYFGTRYGHRVLSLGTTLYLIGGNRAGVRNDVWASTNGSAWTNILTNQNPSPTQFSRRMDFGAVTFNGALWVIGGSTGASISLNDVWTSTDGIVWNQVLANGAAGPTHFEGRWGHATLVHNNLLWIIGGADGYPAPSTSSYGYSDVWNSPDGVTWTKVFDGRQDLVGNFDDSFGAPYYHQAVSNAGRIWLTCGWEWPLWGPTRTVGSTPDGADWTYDPNAPFAQRFYHLSLTFQNSVWIMGGMNNLGARTYFRDVWRSP